MCIHFCVHTYMQKCPNKNIQHLLRGSGYTHTHSHTYARPILPSSSPFPSLSSRHPSLSAAMECETNFYHYTLQVKKGSWECVIYAGFDFYVASTGSSIIALPGTLVHRAPDEMLSWHRYQSPHACPRPVPDEQEERGRRREEGRRGVYVL